MTGQKKRITLSLLLCALLPLTPTNANAGGRLDDIILSTSSSAGTWSDPLGGGHYVYGGDFTIKLRSSSGVPTIFQFKIPDMKRGCSGISIEGGFLGYLGLDKLQDALSDAGSSLMFGIFLGIEYSMPPIAAVFDKIRSWANALQAMLQNGCNIGKAIGAASGIGQTITDSELGKAINEPFTNLSSFISDGDFGINAMKALSRCNGDPQNPDCALAKKIGGSINNKIEKDIKTKPNALPKNASSTGKLLDKTVRSSSNQISTVTDLKTFYNSGSIGCSGASYNTVRAEDKLIDALKYTFFGEIGAGERDIQEHADAIDITACRYQEGKYADMVSSSLTTGMEDWLSAPEYSRIHPFVSDANDAARMLVYGIEKISDKYPNISGNTVSIPNRKILFLNLPHAYNTAGEATKVSRAIYVSGEAIAGDSAYELEWDGAFKQSLKGIRELVSSSSGVPQASASTTYSEYDTSNIASVNIPLLTPSTKKFATILAKMEKRARGTTTEIEALKVELAKRNAILFAKQLIGGIESRALMLNDGISGDKTVIEYYIRDIQDRSRRIQTILADLEKEIGVDKLADRFKKLEEEQSIESMKAR